MLVRFQIISSWNICINFNSKYFGCNPGWKPRYDLIEGAQEALDDPDHPVTSIYKEEYAYKTLKFREAMTEGNAVFYQPPNPIKCGGAPLKITFLSESRWRDLGRRNNINQQNTEIIEFMTKIKIE